MTRRTWLAISGAAGLQRALGQTADNDPLRMLRVGHPRLILLEADLDKLRLATHENVLAKRVYSDLEKECDRLLSVPPVEYKLNAQKLQLQTRRAVDRVTTLALMYRLSGREAWLRRAVMELNAAANFKDWNPARFVETAEMTHAFAIGYDWLFNALTPEERAWMRDAIITKGLDPALPAYQHQNWWTREHYNWNVVCNGGMMLGALAVGDDVNAIASEIVRGALESIPRGLSTLGTDGGWPEGPGYAEYTARYAALFFASLDTALGTDYGLSGFHGLDRAGRFRLYTTGPMNRMFNFADAGEDPGLAPEMFWMAKRFSVPAYAWSEQKQLERSTHPDAYDLAWFDRDGKPPAPPAFGLDSVFHGVGIATFRSAWDDPNAIFLAVRGGDNKLPHAHLDLGNFVLDAGGVRWASDLGADDTNGPGVVRSGLYRVRTEAHNTLLIDGDNQDLKAEAHLTRQELSQDFSWVQFDIAKATPKVRQWTRRIGLAQRQAVVMEDSLRTDAPVEVIWNMMTDSDISVNGPTATLHKNGWNLAAEIRTPRHAVFDIAPVRTPAGQPQNTKFQKLIVRLPDKVTDLDLNIVLTPYRDGQTKPKIANQFPAS